jgi:hypothetical protein
VSGASIDRKVAGALAKAGRLLGYDAVHYRPVDAVNPLQDRNIVGKTRLAWSEDEGFSKTPDAPLAYFRLYADHRRLARGDLLAVPSQGRTFVVTSVEPIRGAVGVSADARADVLRPEYDVTADRKQTLRPVATAVPVAVATRGSAPNANALASVRSPLSTGQSTVELWAFAPQGTIQLNDVLQLGPDRFQVTGVSVEPGGTRVSAISTKVGR